MDAPFCRNEGTTRRQREPEQGVLCAALVPQWRRLTETESAICMARARRSDAVLHKLAPPDP